MVKAVIFDCFGVLYGHEKNVLLLEYIHMLKSDYKIGLLSNITRQRLEKIFSDDELQELFEVVVPSDDIGYCKPDAESYLHTARMLGVVPELCIMVDDRDDCCEGAKAIGMQAIKYEYFDDFVEKLNAQLK